MVTPKNNICERLALQSRDAMLQVDQMPLLPTELMLNYSLHQ